MSLSRQHLATDVVECVQFINAQQKKIATVETCKLKETVNESLRDVEAKLCNLVSQIINAPLTGRLVMPFPADCLTPSQKQFSLYQQLNLDK